MGTRQKSHTPETPSERLVRDIRRATRKQYSAEEKIRIVLVWNRIPDGIRDRIVNMALDEPELSPRELAARFTDTQDYFVSEASVYRLLKAHDLITSPAFIVIKAAGEFRDKTTATNQLRQTDFSNSRCCHRRIEFLTRGWIGSGQLSERCGVQENQTTSFATKHCRLMLTHDIVTVAIKVILLRAT